MQQLRTSIQFGSTHIPFQLLYSSRRKSINISVSPNGKILVTAPIGLQFEEIKLAVQKRAHWLANKLRSFSDNGGECLPKEFVSGESFSYLGRNYRLKVRPINTLKTSVRLLHGRFEIVVESHLSTKQRSEVVRKELSRWYKEHAGKRIGERIKILSMRLGVVPPPFILSDQQKRWASCDSSGRIRINWRIIMAPITLIDYVVAHELCHLIHHDHSSAFWKLLRILIPDYDARRERLRREGLRFTL
jgi:predicted metal-dependent hydrolase